ncbi:MAG: msbA2 [Candidatus Saccharibacteria bacterium]|nr:msbA2 [Candidatus Saccharibacteria bacterium]
MAEKKIKYKEVPHALKYAITIIWRISPGYVIGSVAIQLQDLVLPYVTLFIAASVTSRLPKLLDHHQGLTTVIWLVIAAAAVEVFSRVSDTFIRNQSRRAEARVAIIMREQFYIAYARLPYYLYEDKATIDASNYAELFMTNFGRFGLRQLLESTSSVLDLIFATIALAAVAWYVPLFFLALLPFLIRAVFRLNRDQAKAYYDNRTDERRVWAIEALFFPRTIKETRLYGLVGHLLQTRREASLRTQTRDLKVETRRDRMTLQQDGLVQFSSLVASLVAIYRIAYQGSPLGVFVLAQQLTSRAGTAVNSLFSQLSSFDQDLYGFAEYRYITETLQAASRDNLINSIDQPNIALEDVSFRYPQSGKNVLHTVSLEIPFGSTLAIVGENGAGKTTLTKLLLGLYRPANGTMRVNGHELYNIDENVWLSHIGVLLQDFGLNEDITLREAIWFGDITKPDSDEALRPAVDLAGLTEIIKELPHGLDTYLGKWIDEDKGTELSGGQLQRLAIARAAFRNPDILILDEPTSAIDANAEEKIFNKLMAARKGKTTIFISHRFSTVRRAEMIAYMHHGKLVEYGTHEALMAQKSRYYDMFTLQAEGYR